MVALAITFLLFLMICILLSIAGVGSGLALWWDTGEEKASAAGGRSTRLLALAQTSPAPTFSPTPTATLIPTQAATPPPTATVTATPVPASPTATPVPPTATSIPTDTPPPAPTATDAPAPTPTPAFVFDVVEFDKFSTNHTNFDVYIAITDADNRPLAGYRVVGQHSGGMQKESDVSANRWTQNSGAMHYKAGNIKYEVFNSPGGVWTLQLVDEGGQPMAPLLEFPFDTNSPAWYFVLYRRN